MFTAEQRATIGKYASEHGNPTAVKKFKANIDGGQLGESTVRLFKKRYIEELEQNPSGARPKQLRAVGSSRASRALALPLLGLGTKITTNYSQSKACSS